MSFSSTTAKVQYSPNGSTTVFAYPFYILDSSHLKITSTNETTGVDTVITTGFTVSGVGNTSGGNVTFSVAPASTVQLTFERRVPLTQLLSLATVSSIPLEELEKALDKIMMTIQQIGTTGGDVDRSLRYKSSEPSGYVSEIPPIADRKGCVIFFNATTGAMEVVDADDVFSTQISSINSSVSTATTAATNASSSATSASTSASTATTQAGIATTKASEASASAASINLPSITGNSLKALRAKSDESGLEYFDLSLTSVKETITQSAHGFAVKDVLKFSGGVYAKAQGTTGNSEAVGVVESVTTNTFVIVYSGRISGLSGLTANTEYFLDASTAGAITSTAPTASGNVQRSILFATSTSSAIVNISRIGVLK